MIRHKNFASLLIAALALGGATVSLSACDAVNNLTKDKSAAEEEDGKDDKKAEATEDKDDNKAEDDKDKEKEQELADGAGGSGDKAEEEAPTAATPAPVAAQPAPSILKPDLTAQPRPGTPAPQPIPTADPKAVASAVNSAVRKRFPRFKIPLPKK